MPNAEHLKKRGNKGEPAQSERITGNEDRAAVIERLIEKISGQLEHGKGKATVNDFIKLLQLQREVQEEQPKEITVRWIEPVNVEA